MEGWALLPAALGCSARISHASQCCHTGKGTASAFPSLFWGCCWELGSALRLLEPPSTAPVPHDVPDEGSWHRVAPWWPWGSVPSPAAAPRCLCKEIPSLGCTSRRRAACSAKTASSGAPIGTWLCVGLSACLALRPSLSPYSQVTPT